MQKTDEGVENAYICNIQIQILCQNYVAGSEIILILTSYLFWLRRIAFWIL